MHAVAMVHELCNKINLLRWFMLSLFSYEREINDVQRLTFRFSFSPSLSLFQVSLSIASTNGYTTKCTCFSCHFQIVHVNIQLCHQLRFIRFVHPVRVRMVDSLHLHLKCTYSNCRTSETFYL